MAYEEEMIRMMREQTEVLKAVVKEIKNLSLLFEKYDSEYQVEIENQGGIREGWQNICNNI